MKFFVFFSFLFLSILSGCATTKHKVNDLPNAEWKAGIYDINSGEKITEEELWTRLEKTRFVLVGESHDSPEDHALQAKIVGKIGKDGLVGFEMFQRPFQNILDQFSKGEITEEELLQRSQWEKRWGFKVELYSPIWMTAKKINADLIALNVRKELTKRVSAVGIDKLSQGEKEDIVEMDLSNDAYKIWLEGIFSGHGMKFTKQKMQRFYEAQVLWDETMADSAVRALEERKKSKIILIVGRGHFEWKWGIPSRIERRIGVENKDAIKVIIPSNGELPSIENLKENNFADFVWIYEEVKKTD